MNEEEGHFGGINEEIERKTFLSKNSVVTLWRTVQVKLFSIKIYITICLGKHRIAKGTMVKRIFSGQLGPVTSLECTLYEVKSSLIRNVLISPLGEQLGRCFIK